MAKKIYKYPLRLAGDNSSVMMPLGAKVVMTEMQHGIPCVWALVDPTAEQRSHRFVIVGTGHPTPNELCYVGGMLDGEFVWHIFGEPWVAVDGPNYMLMGER